MALVFDGTGKISFPNIMDFGSFTKPLFISSVCKTFVSNSYQYIFAGHTYDNSSFGGMLLAFPSDQTYESRILIGQATTNYATNSINNAMSTQGVVGNWAFVGVQYRGNKTTPSDMYIERFKNGNIPSDVKDASFTSASGTQTDQDGHNTIGGRLYDGLRNFLGWIEYVAIWFDCELTTEEIASLSNGISPFKIRPQNLVFCPMLQNPDHIIDIISGQKGQKIGGVYRARGPGISY